MVSMNFLSLEKLYKIFDRKIEWDYFEIYIEFIFSVVFPLMMLVYQGIIFA